MYELSDTFVSLQNRRYQSGRLSQGDFLNVLDGASEAASEAARCLKWEDPESFEGYVRASAERLSQEVAGFARRLREMEEKQAEPEK